MLKIRVIPTLLWKDFGLVKGVQFNSWRRIGPVLQSIKLFNERDVDELVLLDISATEQERDLDYDSISDFCDNCFIPLTVGGGISNIDQVQKLFNCGADKVSINSFLYKKPELINKISDKFGSQSLVVSIDVKKQNNSWVCYGNCGKENMNINVIKWCKEVESRGAGEILLTSIDNDGTFLGYDFELLKTITNQVSIPVIASGGAGNNSDFVRAVNYSGVSAVAAASIFQFTEKTPDDIKDAMNKEGIPVRID